MRSSRPVGGIVWLASYPKSGNTWLRALLTNYLQDPAEPADINTLLGSPGAASRKLFDEWCGAKSSDLTPEEVERARPRVYESLARSTSKRLFLKVHDACSTTSAGEPLFPSAVTRAVLYVVRHPADVAVSYAHHRGCTPDTAIRLLSDRTHALAAGTTGVEGQLPQRLTSWNEHVSSWLDAALPVFCVRYEDLHTDPEGTLRGILDFLGEPRDPGRLTRAVRFASFAELSRQERERGFFERPSRARAFFRAGRTGAGRTLTPLQARRILGNHGAMMHRLNYRRAVL